MARSVYRILEDRDAAMEKLLLAVAAERGLATPEGIPARVRWQVVEDAEARYLDWRTRSQSETKPIIRTKADVALSNLYVADHAE